MAKPKHAKKTKAKKTAKKKPAKRAAKKTKAKRKSGGKKKPSAAQLASQARFTAMVKAKAAAAGKHPLAGYKGKGSPGFGTGSGTSAGFARVAPGTKKVAKVVKAVDRAAKKAEKAMSKASKRVAKKVGKKKTPNLNLSGGKQYGPVISPAQRKRLASSKTRDAQDAATKAIAQDVAHAAATHTAKALHKQHRNVLKRRLEEATKRMEAECDDKISDVKKEAHAAQAKIRAATAKAKREAKKAAKKASKSTGFARGPLQTAPTATTKAAKKAAKKAARKAAKATKAPKAPKAPKAKKARKKGRKKANTGPGPKTFPGARMNAPRRGVSPRMGGAVREVDANEIIKGGRAMAKIGNKGVLNFWTCAGPVRSGCGSTGHVVRGVRRHANVPGIGDMTTRLRPGSKEVVI
jgi:hypothetical protein